ncbi:MAG: hypothetical protein ACRCYU_14465 [Nocardioides sp.]
MKFYADLPLRRSRQIIGDLMLVGWVTLWIKMAYVIHAVTLKLGAVGQLTDRSATALAKQMEAAGGAMDQVPVVGDRASAPFGKAADASDNLAEAGRAQVQAVDELAFWLGLITACIPILIVGGGYLYLRWRFVRAATAGRKFVDSSADVDLFALRAMANQPLHVLARISDDPAGAWRGRDGPVIARLADLELRESGLRPHPRTSVD